MNPISFSNLLRPVFLSSLIVSTVACGGPIDEYEGIDDEYAVEESEIRMRRGRASRRVRAANGRVQARRRCQGTDIEVGTPHAPFFGGEFHVLTTARNVGSTAFSAAPGDAKLVLLRRRLGFTPPITETLCDRTSITNLSPRELKFTTGVYRPAGFLRMGHDEPSYGECQAEDEIIAKLQLARSTYTDGDPANNDCNSRNNVAKITVQYMVECPW